MARDVGVGVVTVVKGKKKRTGWWVPEGKLVATERAESQSRVNQRARGLARHQRTDPVACRKK